MDMLEQTIQEVLANWPEDLPPSLQSMVIAAVVRARSLDLKVKSRG